MRIRSERATDAGTIGSLITDAFRTAAHADGTEADIVAKLRATGGLALSLVAEAGGEIVGHVAASDASVGGETGWSVIGPLAVLEAYRRRGIGAGLMEEAIARLDARPAQGIVLVGDPAYYGRFGFRAAADIVWPGIPPQYVLALPLASTAGWGTVVCHPAFCTGPA